MTSDCGEDRLHRALLDLKSSRRATVARGIDELEAIKTDCAGTSAARAAAQAIVEHAARPSIVLSAVALSRRETIAIERVRQSSSWDSPGLREVVGLLPMIPTAAFSHELNRSLSTLLNRLMERQAPNMRSAMELLQVLEHIAALPEYHRSIQQTAVRLRRFVENLQAQQVVRRVDELLSRGDIETASEFAQSHCAISPQIAELHEILRHGAFVSHGLLRLEQRPTGWSDWADTQAEWERLSELAQRIDSRLSMFRDAWLNGLSGTRDRLDQMLEQRVDQMSTLDEIARLPGELGPAARWDERAVSATLGSSLNRFATRLIESAAGSNGLIVLSECLEATFPVPWGPLGKWAQELRSRCLQAAVADAFRAENWDALRTALEKARPADSSAQPQLAGWQTVADNLEIIQKAALHSREIGYASVPELTAWWRTWSELRASLLERGVLTANPLVARWLDEIVEPSSQHSQRRLAEALRLLPLEDSARYCDELQRVAGGWPFVATFIAGVAVRRSLEQARSEGAESFAAAILARRRELSCDAPEVGARLALDAITMLWKEPQPPADSIRSLCSVDGFRQQPALRAALDREMLFLQFTDTANTAVKLAEYITQPALDADESTRLDWSVRLDQLRQIWIGPRDLAKGVFAALLAASLTGATPKLELQRQRLLDAQMTIYGGLEKLSHGSGWPMPASFAALREAVARELEVRDEIAAVRQFLPHVEFDLPHTDRLQGAAELLDCLSFYATAKLDLDAAATPDALDQLGECMAAKLQAIGKLCARLGVPPPFDSAASRDVKDYVASLGDSFNLLADFQRHLKPALTLASDQKFPGWHPLVDCVEELRRHWSHMALPQSAGLARAVLGQLWVTLESSVGDSLPQPQGLDSTLVTQRIKTLSVAADAAIRTLAFVRKRVISPDVANNRELVDEFLTHLPLAPPPGQRAKRCLDIALGGGDARALLDAIRQLLPEWIAARRGQLSIAVQGA